MALTEENISNLTVTINSIIESGLAESVLKRLDSFCCEIKTSDTFLIAFSIEKVEQTIKNECNVTEIPEGLSNVAIDMVCGEVLSCKHRVGQLELSELNLDGALESVKVGNATVSFDNNTSDEIKFNTLISVLSNAGRGQFACYRKIKW